MVVVRHDACAARERKKERQRSRHSTIHPTFHPTTDKVEKSPQDIYSSLIKIFSFAYFKLMTI